MEKIKSLLTPGKSTDDEIMYGSGRTGDSTHSAHNGLSGEGSHFNTSRDTTTGSGAENTTTGPHSSNLSNKADPKVDSDADRSRILGNTGPGTEKSTTGPHSSNLANKADPRVDSDLDGSRKLGNTTQGAGNTDPFSMPGTFPSLPGNPYTSQELDPRIGGPSRTAASEPSVGTTSTKSDTTSKAGQTERNIATSTDHHLGRNTAAIGTAGAVGEGIHHKQHDKRQTLSTLGPDTTSSGLNTTASPAGTRMEPGKSTTTATGPNDSNVVDKTGLGFDSENLRAVSSAGSGHHYGRDAALVGGAAAVGGGIQHHDNKNENLTTSGTSPSGVGPYQNVTPGTTAQQFSITHTTTTANRLDPRINQQSGLPIENASHHGPLTGGGKSADEAHDASKHHVGHNVAVGTGSVGLAEHEHRKNDVHRGQGIDSSIGIGSNTEPYKENNTHSKTTESGSATGVRSHEAAADPKSRSDTTGTLGHHLGGDAVVGAGAVGLAEHENRKHRDETGRGPMTGTTNNYSSSPDPIPTTTGPHSKNWMNKLDPRVKSTPKTAPDGSATNDSQRGVASGATLAGAGAHETEKHRSAADSSHDGNLSKDHHYGRDAAGVGAAGVGAHELNKHQKEHERLNEQRHPSTTGPVTGHQKPDSTNLVGTTTISASEHERNKLEAARNQPGNHYGQSTYGRDHDKALAGVGSENVGTQLHHRGQESGDGSTAAEMTQDRDADHHLGRDAAGAGVVGGGLYEAEKHHKHDKDMTAAEEERKRELKREEQEAKQEKKEAKREEKEAKRDHHDHKEEKKHHGLLSFLHRDKTKKYSKEEEDEFDRQEREQCSHTGRDVAIGGAAVAGAGYEAEKHHNHHHNGPAMETNTMKPLPVAPGNNGIGTGEGTGNALVMDRKRGEGYDVASKTGTDHHHGHDVAAVGEHEHNKHSSSHSYVQGTKGYKESPTSGGVDDLNSSSTTRPAGQSGVPEGATGPHNSRPANAADPRVESDMNESHRTGADHHTTGTSSSSGFTGTKHSGRDTEVGAGTGSAVAHEQSTGSAVGGAHLPGTAPKSNVLRKDPPANHPAAVGVLSEANTDQDGRLVEGHLPATGTGNC